MEYQEPQPGDTIFCWLDGPNHLGHRQMLYLGPDKNQQDNLLVQSVQFGWNIISMSELPKDKHRTLGVQNLIEVFKEQDKITGYIYRFRDNGKPILITVKLIDDVWKIKKDFKQPSWMKVEKKEKTNARGARSPKNRRSDE